MVRTGGGFEYTLRVGRSHRSRTMSCGDAALGDLHGHGAERTARDADRSALHYPVVLGPSSQRRAGRRRRVRARRARACACCIHTDKPIARGELALGSASTVPLRSTGECTVEAELVLTKDDSYRIRLADADGLKSSGEAEYFIRADGRSPSRRAHPAAFSRSADHAARGGADRGAGRRRLRHRVVRAGVRRGGRRGTRRAVRADRGHQRAEDRDRACCRPRTCGVKPGDVITYYARARDVARGKPSIDGDERHLLPRGEAVQRGVRRGRRARAAAAPAIRRSRA